MLVPGREPTGETHSLGLPWAGPEEERRARRGDVAEGDKYTALGARG